MKKQTFLLILSLLTIVSCIANDTLYIRLSDYRGNIRSKTGKYLRKCIREKGNYHCLDYSPRHILVSESYYSDTSFTKPMFCHRFYREQTGSIYQTFCYENGKLNGYAVRYNEKGDTARCQFYKDGIAEKDNDKGDFDVTFTRTEIAPSFPGGEEAWKKYVKRNVQYPKSLTEKITGVVSVQFIVDYSGELMEVGIKKGLHPLLDAEALRVVKNSAPWQPANQNGHTVKCYYTVQIKF
ncbi:MAG: energy transducer TonB [Chitinophagaceae bacterium]|nr:energy transducer TonB [Chitinophagaceae bacterium]